MKNIGLRNRSATAPALPSIAIPDAILPSAIHGYVPPASMQVVTPTLSSRRGSMTLLQLIVFIMRKSCVDTYGTKDRNVPVSHCRLASSVDQPKRVSSTQNHQKLTWLDSAFTWPRNFLKALCLFGKPCSAVGH